MDGVLFGRVRLELCSLVDHAYGVLLSVGCEINKFIVLNNIKQQVEYPQECAKGAEHPGHFIRSLFGIRGGQYQCLDA
jgi:hypothetical protein